MHKFIVPSIPPKKFAKYIEHTNLRPTSTMQEIIETCEVSKKLGFATCVVPLFMIKEASNVLKGYDVRPCTVIGFPIGYIPTSMKIKELKYAIDNGAKEVDSVININYVKSRKYEYIQKEVKELVNIAHKHGIVLKIIIETNLLTDYEKIKLANILMNNNVDFIKTNTGFTGKGVTIHDVVLIKKAINNKIGIKASGGIRYAEDALALIQAGANRLGTSSGDKIFKEYLKFYE